MKTETSINGFELMFKDGVLYVSQSKGVLLIAMNVAKTYYKDDHWLYIP